MSSPGRRSLPEKIWVIVRVRGPSILQLIADGYLVRPVVFCPHAEDARRLVADVGVSKGEFITSQLSEKLNRKELVGDIIRTWQEKAAGLKTIVFCVDVAHSKAVCDDFLASGIAAEQLDYRTARDDRKDIIDRFRSGETLVLTSVNILGVGFDVPDVGAAILARPTLSEALFIQQVGRALRTHLGKDKAIILDHAANTLRFGLPQDFVVPDLGDGDHKSGSKKQRADNLVTCGNCGAVMEVGQSICPACGIERPVRKTSVHYIDADLVEQGAGRSAPPTQEIKLAWYAGLMGYAEQRGYKPGWAFHKFEEKFGHKPANTWRWTEPTPPTLEILRWIKSRQIAWAKTQEKQAKPVRPCPSCGSTSTTTGPGTGPHAARLNCADCGAFVQWLPKAQG